MKKSLTNRVEPTAVSIEPGSDFQLAAQVVELIVGHAAWLSV